MMTIATPEPVIQPVDQFAADLSKVCGRFQVSPCPEVAEITSHVSLKKTAGFDIASVGQNADRIVRTRTDIRRNPGDHFFLILQDKGEATLSQGEEAAHLETGDFFVVDSDQPTDFRYSGRYSHQLSLHLPRDEQIRRFGDRIYGGMKISHKDPLANAMRLVLASVIGANHDHGTHLSEAFHSVFGAYLLNRALGTKGRPDPHQLMIQRATEVMAQFYRDPDFGVHHLADRLGVSLRSLQRSFQHADTTLQGRLAKIRLDAAAHMIRKRSHPSVAEIAFACGYADLSTFHRHYKARFDQSPGAEMRDRRRLQ